MKVPASEPSTGDADRIAERIAAELAVAMADQERVAALCAELAASLGSPPSTEDVSRLCGLGALLRSRLDAAAAPLAELLETAAGRACDPWPLLEPLIGARHRPTSLRGLALARRLAEERRFAPGPREARDLAALLDEEPSSLGEPEALAAKIREALDDPPRAERIALAGRRLAETRFDYAAQGKRLGVFFDHVLDLVSRERSSNS